jgi:hypothetical protein
VDDCVPERAVTRRRVSDLPLPPPPQAKTAPGVVPYKGWVPTLTRIISEEGGAALFKGVGPRCAPLPPLPPAFYALGRGRGRAREISQ